LFLIKSIYIAAYGTNYNQPFRRRALSPDQFTIKIAKNKKKTGTHKKVTHHFGGYPAHCDI